MIRSSLINASVINSATGKTTVISTTPSTSTTTGALTVIGGFGVSGNVNVGGDVSIRGNVTTNGKNIDIGAGRLLLAGSGEISDKSGELTITSDNFVDVSGTLRVYSGTRPASTFNGNIEVGGIKCMLPTPSTTTTTGALVVSGGVGVAGNVNATAALITGATTVTGATSITNNTPSTTSGTGALLVTAGGVGVSGSVNAGGNVNATSALITGAATVTGATRLTNNTGSTSTSTGALVVTGGVGIGGNVNAAAALITGDTTVTGAMRLTNNTPSTSTSTGALVVTTGGVGVAGNLYVGNTINTSYSTLPTFSSTSIGYTVGHTGAPLGTIDTQENNTTPTYIFTEGAGTTKTSIATLTPGVYLLTFSAQVNLSNVTFVMYGETSENVNKIEYVNITSTLLAGNDSSRGYQFSVSKCFVVSQNSFNIYLTYKRFSDINYSRIYNTSAVICRIA